MYKNIQAVGKKIIIKPIAEEQSINGFYVPPKERSEKGEVVSVGTEVTSVKIGQVVLFKKWEAVDLDWQNEKLLVFEDGKNHILAVFE